MAMAKYKVEDNVLTSVRGWQFRETKNGAALIEVRFENFIKWTGWCNTTKAKANTLKRLQEMGFKIKNIKEMANDHEYIKGKQFEAKIAEVDEYDGKFYYTASWINNHKDFGFDESSKKLASKFDFGDEVEDEPAKNVMEQDYSVKTDTAFTADDIPF